MFDYVKLKGILCPICGKEAQDWQTKDTDCVLEKVDFYDDAVKTARTSCGRCDSFLTVRKRAAEDVDGTTKRWLSLHANLYRKLPWNAGENIGKIKEQGE